MNLDNFVNISEEDFYIQIGNAFIEKAECIRSISRLEAELENLRFKLSKYDTIPTDYNAFKLTLQIVDSNDQLML